MCALELASGAKKEHIPYAHLMANTKDFVESKYLPGGWKFKDPRNMTKEEILAFFRHVQQREEMHGARDAFRFCKYRMNKQMVGAEYGVDTNVEAARQKALRAKAARDAKKRKNENSGNVESGHGSNLAAQRPDDRPIGNDDLDGLLPFETGSGTGDASSHSTNVNRSNTRLVTQPQLMDPNIDPRLQHPLSEADPQAESGVLDIPVMHMIRVNGAEMTELIRKHGHQPIPPANGPNEGQPEYEVPAAAAALLKRTPHVGKQRQTDEEDPDENDAQAVTGTRTGRRPNQTPGTMRSLRPRQTAAQTDKDPRGQRPMQTPDTTRSLRPRQRAAQAEVNSRSAQKRIGQAAGSRSRRRKGTMP